MEPVDNNQFEVKPINSKRKIATPSSNVYLNPALDLLANEDPMCNTAMEIVPNKKRKQTSCDIAAFENSALDLGISKAAVNEFLVRELNNVRQNFKADIDGEVKSINANSVIANKAADNVRFAGNIDSNTGTEPTYSHVNSMVTSDNDTEVLNTINVSDILPVGVSKIDSVMSVLEQNTNDLLKTGTNQVNVTNIESNITNQILINNASNLSLSFIDRLALDSPNASNQSLYLDDDLNESNIMEIKTITIITKKKRIPQIKNTNPFLEPNMEIDNTVNQNPFLDLNVKPELEYNEEVLNRPVENQMPVVNNLIPRKLFVGDTNSTISTVNESSIHIDSQNEYENIDDYRPESPIYENICEDEGKFNKQSKILGYDVSQFSAVDIMNINKKTLQANSSNESNDSKKDLKYQIFKVSNKLSKKVFKTLKKTFKTDKPDNNTTLNPYEVPRKAPKQKIVVNESGIENFALNLDNSDEIEIEEIDDPEHEYETIKTIRNTRLNMNVTPLKERADDNIDISHNKTNTPGKKVRFDSTLNQEKVITGNSFVYDVQSPGFDAKIDKYHDELENCINERKFLQQNM